MIDYRKLKVGDKLYWSTNEPWETKATKWKATVTEVTEDNAISVLDDDDTVHLWIDDDTAEDYERRS